MNKQQLHGIIEKGAALSPAGPPHRVVAFEPFDLLVSDYTLGSDTADLPENVLTTAAMTHHEILLAYCSDFAVLPMRFGAVFSGLDALKATVKRQNTFYMDALRVLADHFEYSIQLAVDPTPLKPQPVYTSGRNFLADRLRARDNRLGLSEERQHFIQDFEAKVTAIAAQSPHVGGRNPHNIVDVTALFSKSGVHQLRALASNIAPTFQQLGLSLTIKGPWPAYHFVASLTDEMGVA